MNVKKPVGVPSLVESGWNHNIHYHGVVLSAVPQPCALALDVGCGEGRLTRTLAPHCVRVLGVDVDPQVIAAASGAASRPPNVSFLEGDVMSYPFAHGSFAFITAVATLHHLSLESGLKRFRDLLAPGGVLAVVGLYRIHDTKDFLFAAAGRAASWSIRQSRNFAEIGAPTLAPGETLSQIRHAAVAILPGSIIRRCLLFRYSLVWLKPREVPEHRS